MPTTKKEADGEHPASHYLVVEDPQSPSTWHLRVKDTDGQPDHRLMGAAWAALHQGYRGNTYTGPNKQEAIRKLTRMYANEKMDLPGKSLDTNALKSISKTDDELRVGNYIVLFGGRDLEWVRSGKNSDGSMGEFFSPKTDVESAYTKAGVLHVDWEHGDGKKIDGPDAPGEDDVLGYVDWKTARKDEKGIWVERALNRRNQYMKFLDDLIEAGLVGTSSMAVKGGDEVAKNGEILKWPLYRDTLTFSPAEPRMMTDNVVTALKNLAEIVPGLKALQEGEAITDAGDDAERSRLQLKAKAYLFVTEE